MTWKKETLKVAPLDTILKMKYVENATCLFKALSRCQKMKIQAYQCLNAIALKSFFIKNEVVLISFQVGEKKAKKFEKLKLILGCR